MNAATAWKIKYIAELAHKDCSLSTLKNAKAEIEQNCKVFAGYEFQWQDVNRQEVLAAFEKCFTFTRKKDFLEYCETLADAMEGQRIAAEFHARVAHTIKIANRDHGVWLTAEQVIKAAAGNHHFNFTTVAKMLAEAARKAAADDSRTDDEGNDPREWSGNTIENDHAEALVMDRQRTAWRLESDFFGSNDFAARRRIVEEAHAEALELNKRM